MRILLFSILILFSTQCFGQDLSGTRFSKYGINVKQTTETSALVNGKYVTKKLEHIRIDTSYYQGFALVTFYNDSLTYKRIGAKEKKLVIPLKKTQFMPA